jgi:uncharacterized protein YdhG (YjbR/CyaY superfamily)
MARFENIDDYIASFPSDTQTALESVRQVIRRAAPGAGEGISYGIPAFRLGDRYVIWFAGWKRHISVYPIPSGDEALDAELAPHVAAKGTLRFRLDRPIPLELIARIATRLAGSRTSGHR